MRHNETPEETLEHSKALVLQGKALVQRLREHYQSQGLSADQAIARMSAALSPKQLQDARAQVAVEAAQTEQAVAEKVAQFKASRRSLRQEPVTAGRKKLRQFV